MRRENWVRERVAGDRDQLTVVPATIAGEQALRRRKLVADDDPDATEGTRPGRRQRALSAKRPVLAGKRP